MRETTFPPGRRGCLAPLALAVGLASLAPAAIGQEPARPAVATIASAQVSEFKLENGIRVVVVPDRRVPVVTHMVWYAVGAADEGADEHGVAHYLEHMMFKGTPSYPKGQFDRYVISRGGSHNATTSMDDTVYFQRLPKAALAQMMAMEADRMANLKIDDADVASERAVVLEEYRRNEVSISIELDKKVRQAIYSGDPRARTTIGKEEEIKALNGATAQRFYERFYGPGRATVVIAGDIDEAEARALTAATYGRVPVREKLAPRVAGNMPKSGAHQRIEASHERATAVRVGRTYVLPLDVPLDRRDSHAANLFSYIAGGGMTSRMHRRLINEVTMATSVGCSFSYRPQASLFECAASGRVGVTAAQLEPAFEAVLAELAKGVTDDEFDEIKQRFLATSAFRKDNVYDRAHSYGASLARGLAISDVDSADAIVSDLSKSDVERVGQMMLTASRHVTGILGPKPTGPIVAKTSAAN